MNDEIKYQEYTNANRELKSTLFVVAFGKPEDLLELLNAVNDFQYAGPWTFI